MDFVMLEFDENFDYLLYQQQNYYISDNLDTLQNIDAFCFKRGTQSYVGSVRRLVDRVLNVLQSGDHALILGGMATSGLLNEAKYGYKTLTIRYL
jgi:hypothetical protein